MPVHLARVQTQMDPAEPARWPVSLQLQLGRPSGALVSPLGSKRRRGLGCPIPWADKERGRPYKMPWPRTLARVAVPRLPRSPAPGRSRPLLPCAAPLPACPLPQLSGRPSGGCGCAHHPTSRTGTTTRTAARLEPRLPLLPPTAAARQRMAAAPGSLACSSRLSRLADLRRTPAAPAAPQQVHLGCSRRRAQRTVAMAGSGKVRRRLCL